MISYIVDGISIGNWEDAKQWSRKDGRITFTVAKDCPYICDDYYFPLKDGNDGKHNYHILKDAIRELENARNKNDSDILVHCRYGKSRSASVVIGYMIRKHRYNVDQALKFVKSKRDVIKPKYNLIKLLKKYEDRYNIIKNHGHLSSS